VYQNSQLARCVEHFISATYVHASAPVPRAAKMASKVAKLLQARVAVRRQHLAVRIHVYARALSRYQQVVHVLQYTQWTLLLSCGLNGFRTAPCESFSTSRVLSNHRLPCVMLDLHGREEAM
jgi:hypothetical protein